MTISFRTGWCPTGYDFEIIYDVLCTSAGRPMKLGGSPEENHPAEPAEFELADIHIVGERGEECDPTVLERRVAEAEFETEGVQERCLEYLGECLGRNDELVA